jgi:succinate-semialdehyde dehydrogenase/glutarate-semialdehyde dehydrogenase
MPPTEHEMQTKMLVGDAWLDAAAGGRLDVTDPATDDLVASVAYGGQTEARAAIDAAAAALPAWRARPAAERAEPLHRLRKLLMTEQERLADLMTREQGKPLAEARGEIAYAASFIEWAAEEGKRLEGEILPASSADKRILVLRQPVGVTAAITPWNFPTAMITRKLGPALAVGCTMVVKPAEETPLSALALGEIALEAGIPPGVLNIVVGEPEAVGEEFLSNPTVRKLSFTGSTAVGKILMGKAARNVTRLSLELGGHAPFIVFEDSDVDAAVAGAMATKFRNTGQTCICANRFLVQDRIYDEFTAKLEAAVRTLKVGRGLDEGVQVGPLINDAAVEKVGRHVEDARTRGARVRTGGDLVRVDGLADRFFAPTMIEDVTGEMLVCREETFGPVAPIRRFRGEDEAIVLANDSPYGLAAYFFTRDASRLMRVAEALEYGIIGANDGAPSTAQAPFGGMKQSGFGREGGRAGMHEYVEVKYVSWGI